MSRLANPKLINPNLQDWFRRELIEPHDDADRAREGYYKDRNKGLIYKKSADNQIMWVRDHFINAIPKALWKDRLAHEGRPEFGVVGEHRSKSCALPVYYIDLGHARVMLRDNFHDWNISVDADVEIKGSIQHAVWDAGYCFFQGFPDDWQFKEYNAETNNKQFSFWVTNREQLYVFMWLLGRILLDEGK